MILLITTCSTIAHFSTVLSYSIQPDTDINMNKRTTKTFIQKLISAQTPYTIIYMNIINEIIPPIGMANLIVVFNMFYSPVFGS
jgi:hypothetical protein